MLGDVLDDPQHYITGWELSRKRYSRAQRSLGHYYIQRAKWAEAIECYEVALSINPLFPSSWFSCGCAAMRIEKWDAATNAFSRCISLEPEEGEAYGNLAAVYMIQGKLDKAHSAMQIGLKHKRENWKLWENYQHVCMALRDFQSVIQTVLQIFDLNDKKVDIKVLQVLADFVVKDDTDKSGINGRRIEKPVSEMFGKITSRLTNNPDVWRVYSSYHHSLGNLDKAIDLQQRACRAIEATQGWDTDKESFERVVSFIATLVNLYLEQTPTNSTNIHSAKLKVNSIIKKTELSFKELDTFKSLSTLLANLDAKLSNPNTVSEAMQEVPSS
ncbi:hypothetical protein SAMD00019534_110770 [Acytostelium subglobosum LB1]|uniref:hypothetical protein n=1 Tax=Acytostelium subglobosum LB1 TaxID=1410327 RepID=UPI000644C797|nr:hypothetical protein SAMD00019534_110770 [Acytostelium subglobosum LB1]GAM27901.1 hypothetical protein SAMD00019534_110770 [Acytostelium subglobosum LB1]|eukprot:XP_012749184.1 hypothetical protein SAMD00019534_110770 [Acytostelium subglobosum LB1]